MKKKLLNYFLSCIALLVLGVSANATQLSGTYTIDSAGTASTTVFKDFTSAVVFLTSANTRPDGGPANSAPFGVSGPVTFEVMQGTYIEQVDIPAIPGVSATNRVIFDGLPGGTTTRILKWAATAATDAHTLRFNNCTYVTVQNLSILSTGTTYGLIVHFFGANSFNTVKLCSLVVATNSSTNFRGINCSGVNLLTSGGSCSGPTTVSAINNIMIDSNYLSGGYYGIFLSSSGAGSGSFNFYIRGNQLLNAYSNAIAMSGSYGYLIMNNLIKPTAQSGSYGIYHCNGSTGSQSYQIVNNIFENCGTAGINWLTPNPGTAVRSKVAQNYFKPTFISASAQAMNVTYGPNTDVWHNTILLNMPASTGIVTANAASQDFRNNIVIHQSATATGLCMTQASTTTLTNFDYNVFIKNNPSSPDLVQVNSANYTAATFKGASGFNVHSSSDNPLLVNPPSDIRPNDICQKGASIAMTVPTYGALTTDLNGTTRLNPPQIGAMEPAGGLAIDAKAVAIVQPSTYPFYSGAQDVKVVIKNNGNATLTSMNVTISLGGVNSATIAWTGSIGSCVTDTVLFTGANQLSFSAGSNTLRAWVDGPNASIDSNLVNDTISKTFCTPLAVGTYTIDPSGLADFISFTQVANIINCGGILGVGTTTFNVASATYNEQISLDYINGSAAGNPIIFQSIANNPDSVILQFNAGASNNYVLKMYNTSYIKFNAITFKALNATNARIVDMAGLMSYDSITYCKFIGTLSASTANTAALVYANGITGKRNIITNNTFTNGSFGLYLYGAAAAAVSDSNIVENNTFTNCYYQSLAVSLVNNIKIRKNVIIPNMVYTSHYGIYMVTVSGGGTEVIGNSVGNQIGGYAIYMSGVNGTAALPVIVKNNYTSGGTTSSYYGMYIPSATYMQLLNNSTSANSTAATNYGCWTQFTGSTGTTVVIRNNSFVSNSVNTAITNAALYVYNLLYINGNYNNLYCAGPTLVNVASPATNYGNIYAWRNINPYEKNSISYKPGYMSNTNPRPNPMDSCSWALNGNGTYIAGNSTDFDGNPRSTTIFDGPVDIGAFEFTPVSTPPMAITSPSQLATDSTQIFMFAGDTVATIHWETGYAVPSAIEVRRYNGQRPPYIDPSVNNYMFQYLSVVGTPSYYLYTLNQYYRNEWLGKVPSETALRVAKRDTNVIYSWVPFTSSSSAVDTVRNVMTLGAINEINFIFTGTDDANPLPVSLIYFNGVKKQNDVALSWATASETNSAMFIIERSTDMKNWVMAGKVTAAGNSKSLKNYRFTDASVNNVVLYYRLKMVDKDAKFEYSKVVTIIPGIDQQQSIDVYPNPFENQLYIALNSVADQNIVVDVKDIAGKTIARQSVNFTGGNGLLNLEKVNDLKPGIYLISLTVDGTEIVKKVVKQ